MKRNKSFLIITLVFFIVIYLTWSNFSLRMENAALQASYKGLGTEYQQFQAETGIIIKELLEGGALISMSVASMTSSFQAYVGYDIISAQYYLNEAKHLLDTATPIVEDATKRIKRLYNL